MTTRTDSTTETESEDLNLETLVAVPDIGVTLDGQWFPYAPTTRWSLRERARFRAVYQQLSALETKPTPTATDEAKYDALRLDICKLIVPTAPPAKIEALLDVQRGALLADFLSRSGEMLMQIVPLKHIGLMQVAASMTSLGANSSPVSNGSTADRRRGG